MEALEFKVFQEATNIQLEVVFLKIQQVSQPGSRQESSNHHTHQSKRSSRK
jgi:hypothetical protein